MSKNLYDVVKELQNGTAHCIDNADVKSLMFPLVRMYYPYIPFAMSNVILRAEFPLSWNLLKAAANGVKFAGMYKKVVKDENIISIYKRKSDLGLKHLGDVCAFFETDLKTLNMLAQDSDSLKEIQDIDNQIDKMLSFEE